MEELSLDDLLGALQSAQDEKPKVRLSERNIVELVIKLKAEGYLGDGLLHTINGREYVTREQLKKDIARSMDGVGGRIPLVELPAAVGVDLVHCQQQATEAVAESGGSLQLLSGDLIAATFFDTLAAEVADTLLESGAVTVAQVASQFHLPVATLLPALAARLGSIIPGKLEGGLLYTDVHLDRVKARVRGCVRGAIAPISLPSIAKAAGLDGTSASAGPSLASVIEQLAAAGQVAGQLRGGAATWVPAVYAQRQLEDLMQSFRQDRVVQWAAVAKLAVSDPKRRLLTEFPDDMELPHSLVGAEVVAEADSTVEAAIESGQWVDVLPLLPAELSQDDVAALMERLPAVRGIRNGSGCRGPQGTATGGDAHGVVSDTVVASAPFVSRVQAQLVQYAQEVAHQTYQGAEALGTTAKTQQPGRDKPSAAESKQSPAAPEDAASDDDWGKGGGKAKGKKGKNKSVGRKGKVPSAAAPPSASTAKTSAKNSKKGNQGQQDRSDKTASLLASASLADHILGWYPDMADAEGLAETLAERLRGSVIAEYEAARRSHFVARSADRRKACETAAAAMQSSASRLWLLCGGIPVVADNDDDLEAVLRRHLLRTAGCESVDAMLRFLEIAQLQDSIQASGSVEETATASSSLSPTQRSALIHKLPDDMAPAASSAVACLTGSDTQELLTCLEAAAEAGGGRLQWPDKRSQKREIAAHTAVLANALDNCQEPPAALSLIVPLLVTKCFGKAVSLPGRTLSATITRLQQGGGLSDSHHQKLRDFHSKVVEHLSKGDGEDATAATGAALHTELPELKALTLGLKQSTA